MRFFFLLAAMKYGRPSIDGPDKQPKQQRKHADGKTYSNNARRFLHLHGSDSGPARRKGTQLELRRSRLHHPLSTLYRHLGYRATRIVDPILTPLIFP